MKPNTALLAAIAATILAAAPTPGLSAASATPSPSPIPLSLDNAIATALTNNLNYKAAAQDVKAAEARLIQARGGSFPTVSAGYSYEHTQNAAYFFLPVPQPTGPPVLTKSLFSATDINNVNATLQYAIYTGGAVQAAIGAAAAGFAASESDYAAVRADVINNSTNAYFGLVLARREVAIADEAVDVAQQNLTTSNQLYAAGVAAKADVLRQEVSLANAQVDAVRAHNRANVANAQLANLLNTDLGGIIEPTDKLEPQTATYALSEVLADAQKLRPEIAAAADAVTIAQRAVQAARSGTLPTIGLGIEEASSRPNFVNVPQPQLTETLAVVWKLFDGGLTHGKVAEAQAQVGKAEINLQQIRNNVDLETRQAYFNYTAAQSAVTAANSAQVAAAESLRVTQLRYRSGVGTALELTESLLAYTQTQVQDASALADAHVALVALRRAAGLL